MIRNLRSKNLAGILLMALFPLGNCYSRTLSAVVEDIKPSSINQPDKRYPQVNSEGRVRVQISAPEVRPASGTKSSYSPIIYADVPDMAMIRVGKTYYMSSTTMHMSPGIPIMKSTDLVNWNIVNYAYDTLANVDAMNLVHAKSTYGRGSWASSLRFNKGTFYVSTFSQTTGETYIYSTKNIETGPWIRNHFRPALHDNSLFFDDDGRIFMIYGSGRIKVVELKNDLSGIMVGTEKVMIENASLPAGGNIGLSAEGSQLFKVKGKYYLFNITWPKGGMRTVVVHRSDKLTGDYFGKIAFQDEGIAQGGIIDTPDGHWYAYLFQDHGAVGRIPYLIPMKWEDGWPTIGNQGKLPESFDLPSGNGPIPGIVNSDDFNRRVGEPSLPLVWQWNHNPDNTLWSVTERPGYLRLRTGRIDSLFVYSRNTLTQRTFGPQCSGSTLLDVSNLKEGDYAGLCVLQRKFGQVGVKILNGGKYIFMVSNKYDKPTEIQSIALSQNKIFLKIECDFRDKIDIAKFYYSLDGQDWIGIGTSLAMEYTLMEHFMGYRFGLFNYSTKISGGCADFDFFHINDQITR